MSDIKILSSVLEILGEPSHDDTKKYGHHSDGVPIYINKDATTEYPEVVISPFIQKDKFHTDRFIDIHFEDYIEYFNGKFQVDIYSKDIVNLYKISQRIRDRIYDFFNVEAFDYDYNEFFKDEGDYYFNEVFKIDPSDNFFQDIYMIVVEGIKLSRVESKEELIDNTFFADNHGLYIKTDLDIKTIKVFVITQVGRLFENKDSVNDRNIWFSEITETRELSELENNQVERLSFDLNISFSKRRSRSKLPKLDKVKVTQNVKK